MEPQSTDPQLTDDPKGKRKKKSFAVFRPHPSQSNSSAPSSASLSHTSDSHRIVSGQQDGLSSLDKVKLSNSIAGEAAHVPAPPPLSSSSSSSSLTASKQASFSFFKHKKKKAKKKDEKCEKEKGEEESEEEADDRNARSMPEVLFEESLSPEKFEFLPPSVRDVALSPASNTVTTDREISPLDRLPLGKESPSKANRSARTQVSPITAMSGPNSARRFFPLAFSSPRSSPVVTPSGTPGVTPNGTPTSTPSPPTLSPLTPTRGTSSLLRSTSKKMILDKKLTLLDNAPRTPRRDAEESRMSMRSEKRSMGKSHFSTFYLDAHLFWKCQTDLLRMSLLMSRKRASLFVACRIRSVTLP